MVHVPTPEGTTNRGRFAPVWLEGRIELAPGSYDLFLVDGTRSVNVAYTLTPESITEYSARDSDVLSKVEAPAANPEHSWWQNLQTRVSILFTRTMTGIRDRETSGPLWIGLLIALLYGFVHTLGPGHGKAVVISYFVGHGGSLRRGLKMGTQIALFHVLSAIIVVWVADFAVRQATGNAPSDYRLVKLISYSAIAAIGGFMLWKAIRGVRMARAHGHDHDHGEGDHHHEGCHACEAVARERKGPAGWLALAVGSVPCTGALLVLLFGMANNLLGPAILMVVAISLGMAVAMSGIGICAILGRNLVDRKLEGDAVKQHRFASGARIVGAAAVLLIGIGLFAVTWNLETPGSVGAGMTQADQNLAAAEPPGLEVGETEEWGTASGSRTRV
jgi:ABC-type nickel/cobalt efflux system permease component RcnA